MKDKLNPKDKLVSTSFDSTANMSSHKNRVAILLRY